MNIEHDYRMAPGLGVISLDGDIVVYQLAGDHLVWARPLGEPPMTVTPELMAAISADLGRPCL